MSTTYIGTNAWATSAQIPDDGDDISAASVNVALEAWGDRTQWLYQRTGNYRIIKVDSISIAAGVTCIETTQTSFGTEASQVYSFATETVESGDIVRAHVTFGGPGLAPAGGYRMAYWIGLNAATAVGTQYTTYAAHDLCYAMQTQFTTGTAGSCHIAIEAFTGSSTQAQRVMGPLFATWEILRSNA